jgi:hypothetical protein
MEQSIKENSVDFALITSDSLMDKVPSWESYQTLDESQFLDLVDYSKELVNSSGDHRITFLVVAEGVDQTEAEEAALLAEQAKLHKEIEEQQLEKGKKRGALRERSKSILNSIYGI